MHAYTYIYIYIYIIHTQEVVHTRTHTHTRIHMYILECIGRARNWASRVGNLCRAILWMHKALSRQSSTRAWLWSGFGCLHVSLRGSSTRDLRFIGPGTILFMAFEIRNLTYWALGPSDLACNYQPEVSRMLLRTLAEGPRLSNSAAASSQCPENLESVF